MPKFVSEMQAEELAKKHITNYINECNCQSIEDTKLASQKMAAVSVKILEMLHSGDLKVIPIQ